MARMPSTCPDLGTLTWPGRVQLRPAIYQRLSRRLIFLGQCKYEFEDTMNLKKLLLAFGFLLILALALPLRAQTGCDDSPEDPTLVLALVGGVGAIATTLFRLWRRK